MQAGSSGCTREETRPRGKFGSLAGKTSLFFVLRKNQAEVTADSAFSAGIFAIFPFKVRAVCRGLHAVLSGAVGVELHPGTLCASRHARGPGSIPALLGGTGLTQRTRCRAGPAGLRRCCSEMPCGGGQLRLPRPGYGSAHLLCNLAPSSLLLLPLTSFERVTGFWPNGILPASDLPFVLILVCLPCLSISLFLEQAEARDTQVAFLAPGKLGWCWPQCRSFHKREEAGVSEGAQLLQSSRLCF